MKKPIPKIAKAKNMPKKKVITNMPPMEDAQDEAIDKKMGIKEDSKKDKAMDKKAGVKEMSSSDMKANMIKKYGKKIVMD